MPASVSFQTLPSQSSIMVVDDDASARLQLRFSLENNGYKVTEAASGQEALALFQENPSNLVLLDIIMPEMDGFDTCRALRSLPGGAHTPVVMVTGMEDTQTINQAFDAGATDYINKPINMLILGYRVRYWLRSGFILRELKINQARLYQAQDLARLAHWERNLETGEFKVTCHTPEMFGLTLPCDYDSLFTNIVFGDKQAARKLIDEACDAAQAFSIQYQVNLPDGSEQTILNQGEVVTGNTPQSRLAVGAIQDITQLKRAEEALRAANNELERRVEQRTLELQETQKQYLHAEKLAAIGKLSASIAHEFNNPLQGILSILKGLKKRAILEEEDRELLDAAIGESDRMKDLIRSLQDFNRPSSGNKTMMDVNRTLDSLLILQKSDFGCRGISVVNNYAANLPYIMAVSDQIKQVFLNLLTNAADACHQSGGVITISTWREDSNVAVAIKDTGVGIKSEEIENIFRPFYTTKPEVKGTGLGLSVSYGIVQKHQGEIRVESQPQEGTTFTVWLPIIDTEEGTPSGLVVPL